MACGMIQLGPLSGWVIGFISGWFPQALKMLVPVTLFNMFFIFMYFRRPYPGSRSWVLAAAFVWFCSGYLFTIAIWV